MSFEKPLKTEIDKILYDLNKPKEEAKVIIQVIAKMNQYTSFKWTVLETLESKGANRQGIASWLKLEKEVLHLVQRVVKSKLLDLDGNWKGKIALRVVDYIREPPVIKIMYHWDFEVNNGVVNPCE